MSTYIDTENISTEDLQKAANLEDLYESGKEFDDLEAAKATATSKPAAKVTHEKFLKGTGIDYKKDEEFKSADELEAEKDTILYSVPPLPLDCLSPQVRGIVEGIAVAEHVDTWIPFSVLLKSVCATVGANVLLQQDTKYNPAHMWIVLAAQSGQNKSDVNKYIFDAIQHAQREQHKKYKEEIAQYKTDMLKYNTALEASSKDKGVIVPDEPKKPYGIRYYVNDITEESLFTVFLHNPSGVLWNNDEFLTFIQGMGRYKKGDNTGQKSKLLGCYSGEEYAYTRVKNDNITETAERAWLSIYGTIQPDMISKAITEDDFNSGFLQRFTFIFAKKLEPLKPEAVRYAYDPTAARKIFENMLEWPRLTPNGENVPKIAHLQSMSDRLLKEFFYKNELRYFHLGTTFEQSRADRWKAQVSRLILCLHCLDRAASGAPDGGGVVKESTVENGIKIFESLIEHAQEAERRIKKQEGKQKQEEPFAINSLDFVKHITDLFITNNNQYHFDYSERIEGVRKIDILKQRLAGGEKMLTTQRVTSNFERIGFVRSRISSGTRMSTPEGKFQKLVAAAQVYEDAKKDRQGQGKAQTLPTYAVQDTPF